MRKLLKMKIRKACFVDFIRIYTQKINRGEWGEFGHGAKPDKHNKAVHNCMANHILKLPLLKFKTLSKAGKFVVFVFSVIKIYHQVANFNSGNYVLFAVSEYCNTE